MRKKKNDELVESNKNATPTAVQQNPLNKVTALAEPEIKFANKPSIPFEQLKIKSSFSLQDARGQANTQAVAELIVNQSTEIKQTNKEITFEDVKTFVANYIEEKQRQGARQIATIFKTADLKYHNLVIDLTLHNETQREQLLAIKQEFIDELRYTLQNQQINLNIHLSEHEVKVKAYKPIDIFKSMAERNPALMELKKRFDLEIDY